MIIFPACNVTDIKFKPTFVSGLGGNFTGYWLQKARILKKVIQIFEAKATREEAAIHVLTTELQ